MARLPLPCRALAPLVLATAVAVGAARGEEEAVALDFEFYEARVAPIVHRICAECHANPRKRLGRHFLRPIAGRKVRERDHERNFETIGRLVEPGNPAGSIWLLKPLGPRQGGVEHGGGQRIRFDSLEYGTMIDFINGATLARAEPARPSPREPPVVGEDGVTLQAEDLALGGGARVAEDASEACEGGRLVVPGETGGTVQVALRTDAERTWLFTFRVRGPGEGLAWQVDRHPVRTLEPVEAGFVTAADRVVLDGVRPLAPTRGDLRLQDGRLRLHGRHGAPAAFLLPVDVHHVRVEMDVFLPDETDGGDDILLLFEMRDAGNGKFLGLTDGGRRVVMGVREGGLSRVLTSAAAPAHEGEGPRRLRVDQLEGMAVGRVDGRALVDLQLERRLERGRAGALTHGVAEVAALRLFERWVVHETAFHEAPALHLPAGGHVLRVDLPAGGPALDSVTIRPLVR